MTREELTDKIIKFLGDQSKPVKAKIIAGNLGVPRKEINSILYSDKNKTFSVDENYAWFMVSSNAKKIIKKKINFSNLKIKIQ